MLSSRVISRLIFETAHPNMQLVPYYPRGFPSNGKSAEGFSFSAIRDGCTFALELGSKEDAMEDAFVQSFYLWFSILSTGTSVIRCYEYDIGACLEC